MHYVEDEVELRHGANQFGFQKGRPFLLQSALPAEVTLWWDIEDIRQCGQRQRKGAEEMQSTRRKDGIEGVYVYLQLNNTCNSNKVTYHHYAPGFLGNTQIVKQFIAELLEVDEKSSFCVIHLYFTEPSCDLGNGQNLICLQCNVTCRKFYSRLTHNGLLYKQIFFFFLN